MAVHLTEIIITYDLKQTVYEDMFRYETLLRFSSWTEEDFNIETFFYGQFCF